jgi:hypothetical protein
LDKFIVTTSIFPPSEALQLYAALDDWQLLVVGDLRTPHEAYKQLPCEYLSPEYQQAAYPELSEAIGWNSIQRRNIGFVEAWRRGARLIATVDDDNIPLPGWGRDVVVGEEPEVECYSASRHVFDPLSVTNHADLWHRGFPVQLLPEKNQVSKTGPRRSRVLVQANLWNGDPDVDAICRIARRPEVEFDVSGYYCAEQIAPFNSQNTILHRDAFPAYSVLPCVGRMDDIWGSYLFQHEHPDSVVYGPATVYQKRNEQDLVRNLTDEVLGYNKTLELIDSLANPSAVLPESTQAFLAAYRRCFS